MIANQILEKTTSLCPVCLQKIPAWYEQKNDTVYLAKKCPVHGEFRTVLWQGTPNFFDWDVPVTNDQPFSPNHPIEKGCPYDCGLCANHKQQACCVLIELTHRCNQHCAYCFASSGENSGEPEITLPEMAELYAFLLEKSPKRPFNIQLSGGEPTLRQDLADIIALGKEMGFPYIQVNTNGRRLALEPDYAGELAAAGLDTVFLQFDGTNDDIYQSLRNEPLLDIKKAAIRHAAQAGLGVVLVVTIVPGVNDSNLGEIISFTTSHLPMVRGIHFQPVSYFGRYPQAPADRDRITIPLLLRKIEEQTGGSMLATDFVPLMTGHARCSFHGNFIALPDAPLQGLSQTAASCCENHSIEKARGYLARKWSFPQKKAQSQSQGKNFDCRGWDELVAMIGQYSFNITAMAFQDVWNLDLSRLERCRLHVATKDKELIPFCAYNMTDRDGKPLYRKGGLC